MTNTTIFAIATLTGLLLVTVGAQNTFGDSVIEILPIEDSLTTGAKAIPSWVQFNMQSYLDGQISERELLDAFKFLEDEGIMHKSQGAAQEMADLRTENKRLKENIEKEGNAGGIPIPGLTGLAPTRSGGADSPVDDYGRVKVQFHWDEETEQESLHHLRKAYDLNPGFQTKVVQFDSNHDKWIDVLSIDWGTTSSQDCSVAEGSSDENSSCWIRVSQVHAGEEIWPDKYGSTSSSGDPDRPLITGAVPNADDRPTEEVAFYYNKIASASETVHDLVNNGETSTTGWDEGVAAFTSKNYDTTNTSDGVHELAHALGMMNNAIEKEIQTIQGEIAILEELMDMYTSSTTSSARASTQYSESDFEFISRYANQIDTKIQSLQAGLGVLEDMMSSERNKRQLVSTEFENAIEENQDTLQSLKEKTVQIDADGEFWFTNLSPGY